MAESLIPLEFVYCILIQIEVDWLLVFILAICCDMKLDFTISTVHSLIVSSFMRFI